MVVPVIDFSKLDGAEMAATMAQITNGCEEWGFFQVKRSWNGTSCDDRSACGALHSIALLFDRQ
jgi:isopenicillin N synthase-like dioxygenase